MEFTSEKKTSQGMNVISRSTLAKCSSKLAGSYTPLGWRHYTDEEKARHSAYFKGIAAQIDALGPYPDPDAVDQIIGNDTWTCCRCDHCGSKVEYVVQINFSASRITNLCANCIRKAMAIVEDQPSKSLSYHPTINSLEQLLILFTIPILILLILIVQITFDGRFNEFLNLIRPPS